MRDRILLVGEDFGRSSVEVHSDAYALTGASGRRLASLVHEGPNMMLLYMLDFERTNVVELPDDWRDPERVRARVIELYVRMRGRRTILLGQRVWAAFGSPDVPEMTWATLWTDCVVARMPHPSGRSRWWNSPANVEEARWFLKEAVA